MTRIGLIFLGLLVLIFAWLDTLWLKEREAANETGYAIPDDRQRRVHVVRAGVLLDDVAAGGKRGVYVITDRDTGVEYIGISGIGIAEVRR